MGVEDKLSINSVFVEFLGTALGPSYELLLFELNEDNTGVLVEKDLSFITGMQVGDGLPDDVADMLNQNAFTNNKYITCIPSLINSEKLVNLNMLYIRRQPEQKDFLLMLFWDSTDYLTMMSKLYRLSNLNNAFSIPLDVKEIVKLIGEGRVVKINTSKLPLESDADLSDIRSSGIAKIDEVIRDVIGSNVGKQDAYTQEKRQLVVEKLNDLHIFAIKGMIRPVAERLYCSDATVYRYLSYLDK